MLPKEIEAESEEELQTLEWQNICSQKVRYEEGNKWGWSEIACNYTQPNGNAGTVTAYAHTKVQSTG